MQLPQHGIVGLYPSRDAAESARAQMLALGIEPAQIRMMQRAPVGLVPDGSGERAGLRQVPAEGDIAAGMAANATDPIVPAASSRPHFGASPEPGALYLLGDGSGLGALVGAENSRGDVSVLIEQALAAGQTVLVVHGGSGEDVLPVAGKARPDADAVTPARARVPRRLALVSR